MKKRKRKNTKKRKPEILEGMFQLWVYVNGESKAIIPITEHKWHHVALSYRKVFVKK